AEAAGAGLDGILDGWRVRKTNRLGPRHADARGGALDRLRGWRASDQRPACIAAGDSGGHLRLDGYRIFPRDQPRAQLYADGKELIRIEDLIWNYEFEIMDCVVLSWRCILKVWIVRSARVANGG